MDVEDSSERNGPSEAALAAAGRERSVRGSGLTRRRRLAGEPAWNRVMMLGDGSLVQTAAVWRRVVARLIDAVVVTVLIAPFLLYLGVLRWLGLYVWWASLLIAVVVLFGEWLVVSLRGKSLGKHLMGLWIIQIEGPGGHGTRPGPGAAVRRVLLWIPYLLPGTWGMGSMVLLINLGSVVAGILDRPHHRTWHDRLAGTVVVEQAWV